MLRQQREAQQQPEQVGEQHPFVPEVRDAARDSPAPSANGENSILKSVITASPITRDLQRVMVEQRDADQRQREQDEVDRNAGDRRRFRKRRRPRPRAVGNTTAISGAMTAQAGARRAIGEGHRQLARRDRIGADGGRVAPRRRIGSAARRFFVTRIVTGRGERRRRGARGVARTGGPTGPILAFSSPREASRRGRRMSAGRATVRPPAGRLRRRTNRRQRDAMALTRSISRLDLAPDAANGRRRPRPRAAASAVAAQAERARHCRSLHRSRPALPLRQQGLARLVRQAHPTRSSAARSSRCSAASSTSSTTPTSRPRSAASAPATSASLRCRAPALWIRVDYYPDRSQQGHIRGFLATYSDVDHLKRLELEAGQREHRLRLVTDSVGLPILYFDRQLRLRFANKPFADWIGVPADDLLGHPLTISCRPTRSTRCRATSSARSPARPSATIAASARVGRAALGAHHAVPRPRAGRTRRRRVRRDQRHRGRRPHSRGAEVAAVAAAAVRRQHSRPDRLPRQEPALHVRQPGVRQLGLQAAGRDLRQDAVRGHAARRQCVPAAGPQARAGGRARRVRARRRRTPTASGAGCTAASRPTSMRPARCAGCIAPNTTSTT